MPRPKNNDLDDYKTYLLQHTRCGEASANTYAANVRRLLREVHPRSTETLTAFLYGRCPASSRGNIRKAWNHYRDFRRVDGEELPPIDRMDKVQRESVLGTESFLPRPALSQVLLQLTQRFRISAVALSAARWRDLSPASTLPPSASAKDGPFVLLHLPTLHQSFLFPASLVPPLAAWADPGRGQPLMDRPLVPVNEGGELPISAIQLQHFLLRALRSVQIESDEGPRFDVGALFRPTEDAPPVAQPTLLADEEKRARLLAAAQKAEQEDEDWDAEEELTTQDLARQLLR
jgi:hypothetical protein